MASKFELMAPAGSPEALTAALTAGADSVYFGVGRLNMRARSSAKFSDDDARYYIDKTHKFGKKAYITLNSVIYDNDIAELEATIEALSKLKPDAVIASDMAVIELAREAGLRVHISTQANISNKLAVKYYAKFADAVVLARELNLEQVAEINSFIAQNNICGPSGALLRTEMFVHGALCMAISGKCYLSLHMQNDSANRGECLQECRKAYEVTEAESGRKLLVDNQYIMSPKDLKTLHFIDQIAQSGVSIFKIEGRARGPEYVFNVTKAYRTALDQIENADYNSESIAELDNQLNKVFNRGFWDGYYLGQKLGEWTEAPGNKATEKKWYLAQGRRYFAKLGVAEFKMEAGELNVGDKIIITGPTTGVIEFEVPEIRVDLGSVPKAIKGDLFSIPCPRKIRPSDRLYRLMPA